MKLDLIKSAKNTLKDFEKDAAKVNLFMSQILRLIRKWLKTGYIEEGKRIKQEIGTPQGAVISPLMANVFLHYVLCIGPVGSPITEEKSHRGHDNCTVCG